jgi:rhodanese-related sulfurtransferase
MAGLSCAAMNAPMPGPSLIEIGPRRLAERLAGEDPPHLIDVRERFEWRIAHIVGADNLPLSEIHAWWRRLDPEAELVVHCHHGIRSAAVCRALTVEGFRRVVNLRGGIEAWRQEVEPDMPAY